MPRNHPMTLEPSSSASKKVFSIFLFLSFLFHLPLFFIPISSLFGKDKVLKRNRRTIFVETLHRSNASKWLRKKRRLQRKRHLRRKQPPKKRKDLTHPKGQVVDLPPSPNDKIPKKAKYLSEYNTTAKKETVSRHQRLKYKLSMKKLTRRRRLQPKKARYASRGLSIRGGKRGRPRRSKRKKHSRKSSRRRGFFARRKLLRFRLPKMEKKRRLLLRLALKKTRYHYSERNQRKIPGKGKRLIIGLGTPNAKNNRRRNKEESSTPQGKKGGLALPNVRDLLPNFGTLSRIQGAPAPDKIDAPEGEETALNSKRWIYASFFNRVKQQIAQHWNPVAVYQRRDPYRNIYGVKDRSTILSVVLKPNGHLESVSIAQSCGLIFLDNEAIRSVKAAQPFPNPPKGLIKNGKIRFKFGFTLTLSSRRSFRLFR